MEKSVQKSFSKFNFKNVFKKPIMHQLVLVMLLFPLLIHIQKTNFALSHSILETATSALCLSLAVIIINSYKISKNSYFVYLGIVYGFVSVFNFLHDIAYMGVFSTSFNPINLSLQINIAYRIIESFSILASFIFLYKSFKPCVVFYFYGFLSLLLLYVIFYTDWFPTCFICCSGPTRFEIICEWVVLSSMLASMLLFIKNRKLFGKRIAFYMNLYLTFTILTKYTTIANTPDCYGFNLPSHMLKLLSYYFLYKALVERVVKYPLDSLFDDIGRKNYELKKNVDMLNEENVKLEKIKNELQESQEKYKTLLDFLPDAVFLRQDLEIVYANTAAVKLFKAKDRQDLLGKSPFDLTHAGYLENLTRRLEKQTKGEPSSFTCSEFKFDAIDGSIIDAELKSSPLGPKAENLYISVIHDISERKNAQNAVKLLNEARENEKLKTEFFANLSHELKTPINVIYSALQVMDLDNGGDVSKKYHKVIRQNCYRLLRLVNNLIDSTRIDSGFLKLNPVCRNIVPAVEDMVLSISSYVESKGISLVFDTEVEEKFMDFDPDALERIILNLLSNAVKFSHENGTITVNILDKGHKVAICVKDNGIGIPESQQPLVFERFKQVDKSFSRNREGSGIGLSLVKSLVELHKGTITLKSKEGEGSEFIVELPVMENFKNCGESDQPPQSSMIRNINVEFSDIYL